MAIFIPEDKVSEIKNAADIVDIVSEVVLLKKAGRNYLGLCPFHSEKTPSFTVSQEKQIFYCFGCGAGGNVFTFLMKQEGLSFPEAAKILSGRYGIEIPTKTLSPEQKRRMNERESLVTINREAMDFFRRSLLESSAGEKARAYLKKRGMTQETIGRFCLGYAPGTWDSLINLFSKKKISQALAERSGLIVSRKSKTGFYDRFRDRIIFPIFDISGQVIGFGGRVMDDSEPKYLNSPETPVYNKSRSLYGLHAAKSECRASETVFIVEGYFDLLALHQHGMPNSVATLGTSLTPEHVQMLRGLIGENGKAVLVYDSDAAGIKAAQRSIGIFDRGYVNAQILVLPDGYDPDSYLFEFGAEAFRHAAAKAKSIIPFLIDSAIKKHGLTIEGKIRVIADLEDPVASIHDSVARSLYVKEFAERVGVDEAAILEKVRGIAAGATANARKRKWASPVTRRGLRGTGVADSDRGIAGTARGGRLEKQILGMMLQFPDILPEIRKRNVLDHFEDNTLKSIGELILKNPGEGDRKISEILTGTGGDRDKEGIIASLAIGEEPWNRRDCIKLINRFMEVSPSSRENLLMEQIKAAEKDNNEQLLIKLLKEKQQMAIWKEKQKMAVLSEK